MLVEKLLKSFDYASFFETMSTDKKNYFANSAEVDESVRKEYHPACCINAYMELYQRIEMINQVCIEDGTVSGKRFLTFILGWSH